MKVLVSTFGGDDGKSGISQYIMHLMKAFPQVTDDMEFDVLAFAGQEDLYLYGSDRVRLIPAKDIMRRTLPNLALQQVMIPRLCKQGNYDVLFVPAGNRRMPYHSPIPSVGTFHDLSILHVPAKYDRVHMFYNRHVVPALVRQLSHVITISEFSKKDLVDYVRVPEDKITIIHEAADMELYFPRDKVESRGYIAEKYGVKAPYLLYVSRIEHPGKNHVRLINAFNALKQKEDIPHQLVLAGSDWSGAEEVHRVAESCEAARDIIFTGFFPQEDIPTLYSGADVFVFPSLFEGFGLPILEAMASGVPVASSNTSSLPEVAGDAALLFDPHEEAAIEAAIRALLCDEATRADYAARGLAHARAFSWKDCAQRTAEILRETVKAYQQ